MVPQREMRIERRLPELGGRLVLFGGRSIGSRPGSTPRARGPMLSSEQARDLVTHFGTQREAARETGVSRTTLQYWLDPEKQRVAVMRHYEALTGYQTNLRFLKQRRWKALYRRAQREQRRAANGSL